MIASTIPTQNGLAFQASRSKSFSRCGSRLNPLVRASATTQTLNTESTRNHLSNLEKLLQKQAPPPLQHDTKPFQIDSSNGSTRENRFKNLFKDLNLSTIWPEMKTAEEVSPRHLNRLQRLLSKSSMEYSPRNNLASRWREYHGCNDWAGLIDPLDENLRREVVRFGEFIQAAYHTFHSNPATSVEESPLSRQVALSDKSYRVTKGLYTTSSIGLPSWVDDLAPDLGWMTQRSSWIGYVAVCDDKREISRMGRRDIVIALRGTATCLEWAENMRDVLVKVPGEENSGPNQPAKVECGFQSLYKTPGSNMPSLSESVVGEVRRLMELYKGETSSITVTGHSLGAALALLVADELSTCEPEMPPIAVFSFGGPRVGNRAFADRVSNNGVKVLRIVNSQDLITRVPGMFVSEELDQKLRNNSKVAAGVLNVLDNMPWAYAHVGTELRVDSKMSPYLKPDADVACCHDLEAYLHLVDGFLATNCPFRANAKRSLARLVNEQKSNVKKLYISKAKGLRLNLDNQVLVIPSCLPSPS
ncbi:phospholipase A1-Ibeta2, chloroplastic isoform X2 [Telopea speciosissima]|uniref:phospholipase A1-Ibeta2, chloroplastic isoform X2 n=1 Tax=Telopea speciosissima TaxID=54955 RepID=UPI001CC784A0|nr:phospholipase A1-Ibeta2, chloroplastic isoform X2 [Telopea speciosissima]